ncbi:hypothetical protein NDU88_004387 [Pleurodeles waltl]|uniref:Uncharacterized protein n=1 Tax=Pleurodeles waltl TaxID=8319 RepID=A0AAV7TSB0_PLEWA|nr:hypothetical protein NDU88_004387 [Pleurodeles waltl]
MQGGAPQSSAIRATAPLGVNRQEGGGPTSDKHPPPPPPGSRPLFVGSAALQGPASVRGRGIPDPPLAPSTHSAPPTEIPRTGEGLPGPLWLCGPPEVPPPWSSEPLLNSSARARLGTDLGQVKPTPAPPPAKSVPAAPPAIRAWPRRPEAAASAPRLTGVPASPADLLCAGVGLHHRCRDPAANVVRGH